MNAMAIRASGRARVGSAPLGVARIGAAWLGWAASGLIGAIARRPVPSAIGAVVIGTTALFGWNAVHQPAKHPAPLFQAASTVTPPAEPPRRPDFAAAPVPAAAPAANVAAPPVRPAADPVRRPAGNDPIGALLRANDPAPRNAAPDQKPTASVRVANAQRALGKLGYGRIEADGLIGSATRQALEKFERDKNLPVTGSLAPKTARQLAAASGFAID